MVGKKTKPQQSINPVVLTNLINTRLQINFFVS